MQGPPSPAGREVASRRRIDLGQQVETPAHVMLLHRPSRWREQYDEKCQASWIGCRCSTPDCRPVIPSLLAGDGPVGIPRPCRSQSWAAAHTHERRRGPPQSSSPRVLWCRRSRCRGGRRCGLWCVSLSKSMWVPSVSTLLMRSCSDGAPFNGCGARSRHAPNTN